MPNTSAIPNLPQEAQDFLAKLNITATLPGEELVVAILNYAATVRSTMSSANRDALDTIQVQQIQRANAIWNALLDLLGLPK